MMNSNERKEIVLFNQQVEAAGILIPVWWGCEEVATMSLLRENQLEQASWKAIWQYVVKILIPQEKK